MRVVAALAIGYLLGSVLPAYLIGASRGIDVRSEGMRNAGSLNAYALLGRNAGTVTAAYDTLKGVAALGVAFAMGLPEPAAYAAGLAAVVGHRHPFYLGFKGARGLAVNVGLAGYCVVVALTRGWLDLAQLFAFLAAYAGLYVLLRRGAKAQLVLVPVLYALVAVQSRAPAFDVFFGIVLSYIWVLHFQELRYEAETGENRPAGIRRA